jgi:hypothetical protein
VYQHLQEKAEEFTDQLRTSFMLYKNNARLLLTTTIMKTLEHPMPATTITEQEWEHIFKTICKMGLPKAGLSKHYIQIYTFCCDSLKLEISMTWSQLDLY